MNNKSICLNMIVKDESKVIIRCLSSVIHLIDYWVIVDTGSTDGTQKLIQDFLKGIPGELHERPWVDFAQNRNEALYFARRKADYLLFIDADDQLCIPKKFKLPELTKDCYSVHQKIHHDSSTSWNTRILFIQNIPDFEWIGVIHEVLSCQTAKSSELLPEIFLEHQSDGHRSEDKNKAMKDLHTLELAHQNHPNDPRYVFYLAKAYLTAGNHSEALPMFEKRLRMAGSEEEIYFSLYCVAFLQRSMQMEPEIFLRNYLAAYQKNPQRIEPLYDIVEYFVDRKNYFLGHLIAKFAIDECLKKNPPDAIFIDYWKYDWGMLYLFYVCLTNLKKDDEAKKIKKRLLQNPNFDKEKLNFKHS